MEEIDQFCQDESRFCMARLIRRLRVLLQQTKDNAMDIQLYTQIYKDWLGLMDHFGAILSIGFSDIREKGEQIEANSKLINRLLDQQSQLKTMESLINFEF